MYLEFWISAQKFLSDLVYELIAFRFNVDATVAFYQFVVAVVTYFLSNKCTYDQFMTWM